MTRPRKQVVDYFPHAVHHGRTMEIIEKQFGNDGYAFWFKTLEILANTPGHALDLSDDINWEYYVSKIGVSGEKTLEMLNLLLRLSAIDAPLWHNRKMIWCDNFVENIAEAYSKRTTNLPEKPCLLQENHSFLGENKVSGAGNPQRKVKERKVKESINNAPLFFSCDFFEVDVTYRTKLASEYPLLTDGLLNRELSKMEDWLTENRQKKKFGANGKMKNTKLFIKNWLDKVEIRPMAQTLCSHGIPQKECKVCRDYLPRPNGFPKRS